MKNYSTPELEIMEFELADVITNNASLVGGDPEDGEWY